ncbi:hypothetical protein ACP275_08G013900 [Erythranthe tilingii]
MGKNWVILLVILVLFLAGCSSVSASPATRIVSGVVTKVVSTIFKRLWSLKSATKTAIPSRSMMKFEGGYTVETVFDGSKLGIEPHAVEISAAGEIFVLDSENSNIYQISTPLSRHSRPKLLAGSAEGYIGHVDGKLRQARMNHPKGLTLDDSGNLYIADTMNMAIRKITDTGIVTIAGGKVGRGGGHVDGPSEDAKFSDDFDLVYVGSSCSILVIDRGNQAIREIQLHEDDCAHHEDDNLHLGIAVLAAACFFGYMLALLQRRIVSIISHDTEPTPPYVKAMPPAPYKRPHSKSVLPPLIPAENDYDNKQEEGLLSSLGRHTTEFFTGIFSGFKRKPTGHNHTQQHHHYSPRHASSNWPVQESFVIPHEDEPPPAETRDQPMSSSRKGYAITTKDMHKAARQFNQNRPSPYYSGGGGAWEGNYQPQLHHQKHHPPGPQTHYERQNVETEEIVFGAVQEQQHREEVVVKAVDYGDQMYNNHNLRSRSYNYMSYSYGY